MAHPELINMLNEYTATVERYFMVIRLLNQETARILEGDFSDSMYIDELADSARQSAASIARARKEYLAAGGSDSALHQHYSDIRAVHQKAAVNG